MTVVEWCVCQEQMILDLLVETIGGGGEELRNDRSANLSLVETGERERHR